VIFNLFNIKKRQKVLFFIGIFCFFNPLKNSFLAQLTLQDSSVLPLIIINTTGQVILDEPKITAHMGIINKAQGLYNHPTDSFNEYDGIIGIEHRGSSSSFFSKKGYGLETRDSLGQNNNVSLFGMPSENDWVLHGPYSDKSLIRNYLAYYCGSRMYNYCPRTQFVEIIINNDYKGVYLFVEKIKRDKGRVKVSKLDEDDLSGDSLTGGYIIKIDKTTGINNDSWLSNFQTNSPNPKDVSFLYHYPEADDIKPAQKTYIQSFMSTFENALSSAFFLDSSIGYKQYVDINSFVDYYLLNEATRNVDGYRISTFMYKDRDSDNNKLVIGPPWDYNLGWGNADYCDGGLTTGWASDFNSVCSGDNSQIPFWWQRMLTDTEFLNRLNCRWDELRQGPFHTDSMFVLIDSMGSMLSQPAVRNFNTWDILNTWVWPNNFVGGTYSAELNYLKNWIADRFFWMDNNLPGSASDCSFLTNSEIKAPSILTFPNPYIDEFFINIQGGDKKQEVLISMYDLSGVLIFNHKTNIISSSVISSNKMLNGKYISNGIYILSIHIGFEKHNYKLIKQ
jgi:hypothetical protein